MEFLAVEDCPDLRNAKVVDIRASLMAAGAMIDVYDPWVDEQEAENQYGIVMITEPSQAHYDAIIITVKHRVFGELGIERIRAWGKEDCFVYDVKHLFDIDSVDDRL